MTLFDVLDNTPWWQVTVALMGIKLVFDAAEQLGEWLVWLSGKFRG